MTINPMNTARDAHTATLLPNGKVLVAEGQDQYGFYLSSAELYDPATGEWTATGSLSVGRSFHTATLLPNGKVLVAGGSSIGHEVEPTELYDPAGGSWALTGNLNTHRGRHTATLLPNGKVLVAGGWNAGDALASAELYDPASGTWATINPMNTARCWHTATLLPNSKVLVAGGADKDNLVLAGAELYDPGISLAGPFQITSIVQTNLNDLLLTWNTTGTSNIVQVSAGTGASGSYTNSFADLATIVVKTTTTNFWDLGALTNGPARYYRIRSPQ
jgi:hypothetical protein